MLLSKKKVWALAASCLGAQICAMHVSDAAVPPSALGSRAAVQPVAPAPAVTPAQAVQVPQSVTPAQQATQQPAAIKKPNPALAGRRSPLTRTPAMIVPGSRETSYAPLRSRLLSDQAAALSQQNQRAQAARRLAHPATAPAPRVGLQNPAAIASSTMSVPGLATRAAQRDDSRTFTPGVHSINGMEKGAQLTPGGNVTLNGFGFGDGAGSISLVTSAPQSVIDLRVLDWHDSEVYALLPAGVRGVADQPVKIQLITHAGKIYSLDGAQFFGTREEVLLTTNLSRVFHVDADQSWANPVSGDDGSVSRDDFRPGGSIDCKSPGTDLVFFDTLPKGFEVSGVVFWHGRTDSGDGVDGGYAGNRMFFPRYSLGPWSRVSDTQSLLQVKWGVWRSHTSPSVLGDDPTDDCSSNYQLAVSVIGPAGVPVF